MAIRRVIYYVDNIKDMKTNDINKLVMSSQPVYYVKLNKNN